MSKTISTEDQNGASVTELVSGIVGDVQDLGVQHLELFRNEIQQDLRKATDAVSSLAVGLAIVQVGAILMGMMLAQLLSFLAPSMSLWSCYGIVGLIVASLGTVTVFIGLNKLKNVDTLSAQTAQAMKEDAQWLTKPK